MTYEDRGNSPAVHVSRETVDGPATPVLRDRSRAPQVRHHYWGEPVGRKSQSARESTAGSVGWIPVATPAR